MNFIYILYQLQLYLIENGIHDHYKGKPVNAV
jgi:hypothetical protein